MKESLESARNIHQILIIACTIVIAFAFSIKVDKNKFEIANRDLTNIELSISETNRARVEYFKNQATLHNFVKIGFNVDTSFKLKTVGTLRSELSSNWENLDSMWLIYSHEKEGLAAEKAQTVLDISGLPLEIHPNSSVWKSYRGYDYRCDYTRSFRGNDIRNPIVSVDSIFKNLKPVWSEVKDLPLEDAKQRLTDLSTLALEKDKGDVDLPGMKVSGDLMYTIGPSTILALICNSQH